MSQGPHKDKGISPAALAELIVQGSLYKPVEPHRADEPPFPTLWCWNQVFWSWEDGRYVMKTDSDVEGLLLQVARKVMPGITPQDLTLSMKFLRSFQTIDGPSKMPFWLEPNPTQGNVKVIQDAGVDYIATPQDLIQPLRISQGLWDGWQDLTPRWFSAARLPYTYAHGAECPLWTRWLDERLEGDAERINLLQEYFGYLLTNDTSRHVALVLFGDAATGKSTVCKVIQAVIGSDNCSYLPLSSFGQKFSPISTLGKLVNISDEMSPLNPYTENMLKWFISGQTIQTSRIYKGPVSLVPTARIVACMNSWPKFTDQSGGWYRRLLIVTLRKRLKFDEQDPRVEQALLSERAGILNWALEGLARLTRTGGFTRTNLGDDLAADLRCEFQSPTEFARRFVAMEPDGWVSNEALYGAYSGWCRENGWPVNLMKSALGRLVAYQHNTKVCRLRLPDGTQPHGVSGVKLLPADGEHDGQQRIESTPASGGTASDA